MDAYEAETIRVIQSMPSWTPGKDNGKNVRVRLMQPLNLHNSKR